MTEVKIAVEGVVIGGVARKLGSVVHLPDAEADALRAAGLVCAPPMVKCLEYNRLISNRVCQPGDVVPATSLQHAMALHETGAAEFLNPDAFGAKLPARKSPFAVPAGHVRVCALQTFGTHANHYQKDTFRVVPLDKARELERDELVRPERKGLRLKILLDNVRAGGKVMRAGDVAIVDEAEARSIVSSGNAAYMPEAAAETQPLAPRKKVEKVT